MDHDSEYRKAIADIVELWDELAIVAGGRTEHYEAFSEAMNHFRRKFAGIPSNVHDAADRMEEILGVGGNQD